MAGVVGTVSCYDVADRGDNPLMIELLPIWDRSLMDLITTSLLAEFSKEFEIEDLPEDDRFEMLAAASTTTKRLITRRCFSRRHRHRRRCSAYRRRGGHCHGVLITDIDALEELVSAGADYLEVAFVFVQAKRSANFEASQMGAVPVRR